MGFESLDDDQLRVTITSLSITYDAISKKVTRLSGRRRNDAVNELELVERTMSQFKHEQTERWRVHAS